MKTFLSKKSRCYALCLLLTAPCTATAQADSTRTTQTAVATDIVSLGMGLGLDHGGMGMNLTIYPQKNIGFFGGIGYALIGLGYNAGFKARIHFSEYKPSASMFLTGMYGYNTVYKVKNASRYNKMFYGPTIGIGLETPIRPYRAGYWSFGLFLPLRSSEATGYEDYLAAIPGMQIEQRLPPVAISVGYRFVMHPSGARKTPNQERF